MWKLYAITNSSHIDVLEMDAASKTGVDDVRDLIEFSRYGPTSSKYKIFGWWSSYVKKALTLY